MNMKTLISTVLLTAIVLTSTVRANSSTDTLVNTNRLASTNETKATVTTTTINDVVVDILQGAKAVGSDIYQSSKATISKAVDFTIEQTPLVVTEFLHWKLAQSIIYFVALLIPVILLLFIARALRKKSESADIPNKSRYDTDKGDYIIGVWAIRLAALLLLTLNLTFQGLTITKILVAPRVYLIEYVVDSIHGNTNKR